MFIKAGDRLVNLANVSNINIVKYRIVLNMNYSVEIVTQKGKIISDYVYWDASNEEEFNANMEILEDVDYFNENFISKQRNGYINVNEISSIKFVNEKRRVIFNLSHPVGFRDRDGENRITSEFIYANCRTEEEYNEYVSYVINEGI